MSKDKEKKDELEHEERQQEPMEREAECTEDGSREACPEECEESQVTRLTRENADLNDRLLRTLAEYDNYRKRAQREKESIYPEAVAATVAHFLPVLDSFERAVESECADLEFKKGVEMILASMWAAMTGLGVERLGKAGEPFNPEWHHAVARVDDKSMGENVISQVLIQGYKIGDRVLKPAVVQVAN